MNLFAPVPPPYDALEWATLPFAERARMVCRAWAVQGYGTPIGGYFFYALKVVFYIGAWIFFCGFSPGLGGLRDIGSWWLEPVAFQKAMVWSLLFEILGLGCGSGPLTARYFPPFGGFLYFLRPGTTKLPPFPSLPLLGGRTRSRLDVALYLAVAVLALRAVMAPAITTGHLVPLAVLVPLLALTDKTLFLVARGEHYYTVILCFLLAGNWIAGVQAVQLALWFWAGFSKLNHHFATVVCVMTSNSPILRSEALRKRMYRNYPDDLRPSALAVTMAHAGTALEFSVPLMVLLASAGIVPALLAMAFVLALHTYITGNVPMGVPIEWNFAVVYSAFFLFWAHPEVTVFDLGSAPLALYLLAMLVAVPLLGNLFPEKVSFLLAMRYYAGNWPASVWLFRGDSYRKLDRGLRKSSPWVYDQLERFYDRRAAVGLVGKVMAFRLMHLHGRALGLLLPKAIDRPLRDYEWVDGELVAGLAIGWNFGDGHLHDERLLASIQAQCGFEAGELRCIFIESQPLGRPTLHWRIADARMGRLHEGRVSVRELLARQPWDEA